MNLSNNFKNFAIGASMTAAMLGAAAPAMADNHCTAEDKAAIAPVKGHGMRVIDFSNTSESCLKYFAEGTSHKYLTLVAESNSKAFRDATVVAGKKLQSEGMDVQFVYGNDQDGLDTTAQTTIWANGVRRDSAPISIGGIFKIDHIDAAPQKVIDFIHEVGSEVWNTYLKVPEPQAK